jgi:hypothetical protein
MWEIRVRALSVDLFELRTAESTVVNSDQQLPPAGFRNVEFLYAKRSLNGS